MPAKPLTPEQKADAARLKTAFQAYQERLKGEGLPSAQDELAAKLPFGQSAMSQYLNGGIPLNAEALLEFCRLMSVQPDQISPSITERERTWSLMWINPAKYKGEIYPTTPAADQFKLPSDVISAFAGLDSTRAALIMDAMRGMLGLPSQVDSGNSVGRQTAPPKSATG